MEHGSHSTGKKGLVGCHWGDITPEAPGTVRATEVGNPCFAYPPPTFITFPKIKSRKNTFSPDSKQHLKRK